MSTTIPSRWLNYKPIGYKVEGTRFIAFKVPLKEHISNRVSTERRLDDNILLRNIPNLGFIIDLTNTNRYYDPTVFIKKGIKYEKLMIPGKKTPSKNLSDKFNMIVEEFVKNNIDNDKLIGVHCTHGVNRTGYLICNYMISQMAIESKDAINRFANARGYGIERENYITALYKLPETKEKDKSSYQEVRQDNWGKKKQKYNAYDYGSDSKDKLHKTNRNQSSSCQKPLLDNWREQKQEHSKCVKGIDAAYKIQERNKKCSNSCQKLQLDNWRERKPEHIKDNSSRNYSLSNHIERSQFSMPYAVTHQLQSVPQPIRSPPTRLRVDYYNKKPVN